MISFDESWSIILLTVGCLGRDSGFLRLGLRVAPDHEGFGMGLGATNASRVGRLFG